MPNNSAQFSPCSLLPHVRPKVSAYENHNTVSFACSAAGFDGAYRMLHACEIRPRKDHRGVDLISDAPESFLIAGWRMTGPLDFAF
jgi:hypothetical protein